MLYNVKKIEYLDSTQVRVYGRPIQLKTRITAKQSERGSNENANKLIRRWIPKGSHISEFTDQYIKDLQDWINSYPRKIFNYLSANEYKALVA